MVCEEGRDGLCDLSVSAENMHAQNGGGTFLGKYFRFIVEGLDLLRLLPEWSFWRVVCDLEDAVVCRLLKKRALILEIKFGGENAAETDKP
jgi:hypothetical protein